MMASIRRLNATDGEHQNIMISRKKLSLEHGVWDFEIAIPLSRMRGQMMPFSGPDIEKAFAQRRKPKL
jgi:hypothetical protein